jgi:hypothetical protein
MSSDEEVFQVGKPAPAPTCALPLTHANLRGWCAHHDWSEKDGQIPTKFIEYLGFGTSVSWRPPSRGLAVAGRAVAVQVGDGTMLRTCCMDTGAAENPSDRGRASVQQVAGGVRGQALHRNLFRGRNPPLSTPAERALLHLTTLYARRPASCGSQTISCCQVGLLSYDMTESGRGPPRMLARCRRAAHDLTRAGSWRRSAADRTREERVVTGRVRTREQDENKLEYTAIHNAYEEGIEKLLEENLPKVTQHRLS